MTIMTITNIVSVGFEAVDLLKARGVVLSRDDERFIVESIRRRGAFEYSVKAYRGDTTVYRFETLEYHESHKPEAPEAPEAISEALAAVIVAQAEADNLESFDYFDTLEVVKTAGEGV